MSKGKGIFGGFTRRSRRAESKVSINYDEAQQWEDEMLYKANGLDVHTTRWQDPKMLEHWELKDEFDFFTAQTGLSKFARHPHKTYA